MFVVVPFLSYITCLFSFCDTKQGCSSYFKRDLLGSIQHIPALFQQITKLVYRAFVLNKRKLELFSAEWNFSVKAPVGSENI